VAFFGAEIWNCLALLNDKLDKFADLGEIMAQPNHLLQHHHQNKKTKNWIKM
jgi:hypothetical protein